jgi:hypothetical protein
MERTYQPRRQNVLIRQYRQRRDPQYQSDVETNPAFPFGT